MNNCIEMILIALPLLGMSGLVLLAAWMSYRNSKK